MPRVFVESEPEDQPRLVSVESVEQEGSPGGSSQEGIFFEPSDLEEVGLSMQMRLETHGDQPDDSIFDADAMDLKAERAAGESSTSARKRPANSEEANGNPRERPQPPPKQAKTPTAYIENYAARQQKALRSGRTLEKMVEEYKVTTGAKTHFKSLFTYKDGRELKFQAGEDFKMPEQASFSLEEVSESMRSTVVQAISNLVRPSPGPSTSSTTSAFSPSVNAPQRLDQSRCRICGKKEVCEGLIVFPSESVHCNLGTECNYKVHADCLGFPGVTRPQLRNLPKFYCLRHRQIGRQRQGLQPGFVGSEAVNEEETEPSSRGKGRARGRGESAGRTRRARGRAGKT